MITPSEITEIDEKAREIRGYIIDKAIQIELLMDAGLSYYFADEGKENEFLRDFLQNGKTPVIAKRKALRRADLITSEEATHLQKLFDIRNIVAHSSPIKDEESPKIIHKGKETKDMVDLKKDFDEHAESVHSPLQRIISKYYGKKYQKFKVGKFNEISTKEEE